jgi:hypothetical protein
MVSSAVGRPQPVGNSGENTSLSSTKRGRIGIAPPNVTVGRRLGRSGRAIEAYSALDSRPLDQTPTRSCRLIAVGLALWYRILED